MVHIDPRRPEYLDLFKICMEDWGYDGVKLYPPLGIAPNDKRLLPIWEYCHKYHKPIYVHCSPENPIHWSGSKRKLEQMVMDAYPEYKWLINNKELSRKELCALFTNPYNYSELLTIYDNVNVNFCHYGSSVEWDKFMENPKTDNWVNRINELMRSHKNVYADISATLAKKIYTSLLLNLMDRHIIGNRILFGTDYPFHLKDSISERYWTGYLRGRLGEQRVKQLERNFKEFFTHEKIDNTNFY
jgi:predicted TIM-barrel fold metal-dependent hydrolase